MAVVEHPNATIPDSVEVPRVGTLRYELGFPTPETSQKLFDEMDFQRAVQAYLWAISRRVVRVHPAHGQAGLGHRLQRPGHCRQLRRPQVCLAHGERHDDLRLRQHRRGPGAGRDRHPTRSHRRPLGRLLAALAGRRRPARARRGQRRQVPPAATRLRRRGSVVRLLRASGNDEQPQPPGPRHHRRQRRARRRRSASGTSRSTRGASAKIPSRTSSSRSRAS